ncbi:hypothetical protein JOC94_003092 [Bacillus thermophilus]|uniref:Uncharacterized protein n=1 Tax=Siminovitchia thermophila TaxID=1245522 RepID=A0ABS2R8V6_9BACI|nr:hypothetical protein [Siminovitchia thermophila]
MNSVDFVIKRNSRKETAKIGWLSPKPRALALKSAQGKRYIQASASPALKGMGVPVRIAF